MRAPRRSPNPFSRPSRLRRWTSSSAAIAVAREEPQHAAEVGPKIPAPDDPVEMAEAHVLLGEPEVFRQLLARRLLHDARAGEGEERARLRDDDVAERGE